MQEAQAAQQMQYSQSFADKNNAPSKRQPKGSIAHRERDRSDSPARDNLMEGQLNDRSHHSSPPNEQEYFSQDDLAALVEEMEQNPIEFEASASVTQGIANANPRSTPKASKA